MKTKANPTMADLKQSFGDLFRSNFNLKNRSVYQLNNAARQQYRFIERISTFWRNEAFLNTKTAQYYATGKTVNSHAYWPIRHLINDRFMALHIM